MAVNQTDKRRNAARDMINRVDLMMQSLYELNSIVRAFPGGFVDADFTDVEGLRHVDAEKMNLILSNGPAVLTYLETNFIDDVLNAVRPR